MLKFIMPVCAAAALLTLAPSVGRVNAMPVLRPLPAAASLVEQASDLHHRHRHHAHRLVRPEPDDGYGYGNPGGTSSFGGYANRGNGAPPDNEFDPTRPYGGQAAITAPPGTDAYEEQANERRYFCNYAPERC